MITTDHWPGERDPIVYMVQEPMGRDPRTNTPRPLNTVPALDYGTVEVLLDRGPQVMFNAAAVVATLREKLRGFSDRDFILAAGDPVAIGVACAIAARLNEGRFTVLKWDNQEHRYYPVPVDLGWGRADT